MTSLYLGGLLWGTATVCFALYLIVSISKEGIHMNITGLVKLDKCKEIFTQDAEVMNILATGKYKYPSRGILV